MAVPHAVNRKGKAKKKPRIDKLHPGVSLIASPHFLEPHNPRRMPTHPWKAQWNQRMMNLFLG